MSERATYRIKKVDFNEISFVDEAAVEAADVLLLKRAPQASDEALREDEPRMEDITPTPEGDEKPKYPEPQSSDSGSKPVATVQDGPPPKNKDAEDEENRDGPIDKMVDKDIEIEELKEREKEHEEEIEKLRRHVNRLNKRLGPDQSGRVEQEERIEKAFKSASPEMTEIVKSLQAQARKQDDVIQHMQGQMRKAELDARAHELEDIPVDNDEMVEVLEALDEGLSPEKMAKVEKFLSRVAKAFADSPRMREYGHSQAPPSSAMGEYEQLANASMRKSRNGDADLALADAILANPEKYNDYLREER